ncbi:hypothetical protein B0H14DRAFT_2582351 [Mycena olivaceomarginata]|nr:hypothetical protein B0H14DRAFT_2582351 [Mycena olivaceomarginata]
MEAAPSTRSWFRRRTMRTDTTRRTPGPLHLHPKLADPFVPPGLPAREQPARRAGWDRVVRIWARGGPPVSRASGVGAQVGQVGGEGVQEESGGERRRGRGEETEDPSSLCSLPSPRAHPRRAGVIPTERGAGLCGVPKKAVGKDGDVFDHRGVVRGKVGWDGEYVQLQQHEEGRGRSGSRRRGGGRALKRAGARAIWTSCGRSGSMGGGGGDAAVAGDGCVAKKGTLGVHAPYFSARCVPSKSATLEVNLDDFSDGVKWMKDGKEEGWRTYTLRYCKYEPKLRV